MDLRSTMILGNLDPDDPRIYSHGETVVLGVDPSMTGTGYGVIRGDRLFGAGCISTPASLPEPARLWIIFSEILSLIREYGVHHVALEAFSQFYRSHDRAVEEAEVVFAAALSGQSPATRKGRHDRPAVDPKAMFLMKAAQTAVQMAALTSGVPVFLYGVATWKGGPRVSKDKIRRDAQLIYRVPTRNDNICDGVMIAHHHIVRGHLTPERGVYISSQDREPILALITPEGFQNMEFETRGKRSDRAPRRMKQSEQTSS